MALDQSNYYKDKAKRLFERYPLMFKEFKLDEILFLEEDSRAPKNKYGDVKQIGAPYNFITNVKFIITIYEKNVADLNDAQEYIMLMRELMKIDDTFAKLRKFDINDFKLIIDGFGTDWDENELVRHPLDAVESTN